MYIDLAEIALFRQNKAGLYIIFIKPYSPGAHGRTINFTPEQFAERVNDVVHQSLGVIASRNMLIVDMDKEI